MGFLFNNNTMGTGNMTVNPYQIDPNAFKIKNYDGMQNTNNQGYGAAINQQNQSNQNANNLTNNLQNRANGGGVSIAENQAKQGAQQSLAQNLAMQASARGSGQNLGSIQKNTQNAIASSANQIAANGSNLRAGEINSATGQLGAFTQAQQGLAQNQSQYYNTANQNLAQNQAQLGAAQQQLYSQNQNSANQINSQNFNESQKQNGSLAGGLIGGIGSLFAMSDENNKTDIKNADGSMNNFLDSFSKNLKTMKESDQKNKISPTGTGAIGYGLGQAIGASGKALFSGKKTSDAPMNNQGMGREFSNAGNDISQFNMPTFGDAGKVAPMSDFDLTNKNSPNQFFQPNTTPSAWTFSDENLKSDIKSADMGGFLDKLKAHKYEYKNPDMPGAGDGTHYSVMAQELEKTPVGAAMVKDTPDGKVVDYGKGFGTMLASMAEMHDRLKKLEKNRG